MTKIKAQDLLALSLTNIWKIPKGEMTVVYHDGQERTMRHKYAIFDRYIWELFLLFPKTPIPAHCTTLETIGDAYFSAETHIKLFERVFKHIVEFNNLVTFEQKEPLLIRIYEIIDLIQNEILTQASPDLFTIHATDFVNVIKHPTMVAVANSLQPTPESVDMVYRQIRQFIKTNPEPNRFVNAYRAKAINDNQSNQCIGPRGFCTDLDKTVFRLPITSGFIKGMGSLYEMMVESCTAAKSLNANSTHIEKSEYTSRRIQLLSMCVTGVAEVDCGSKEYLDTVVTEQNIEIFKGKYFRTLDDETLRVIKGDEKHLYDQIVSLRSALFCHYHDPAKVCMVCLGQLSNNFPKDSNLGYTFTAHLMHRITQSIMGTKHLTQSVKKALVQLFGPANKYFHTNENGDLFFRPDIDLQGLSLILPNAKVGKLVDVLSLSHTNIGLSKIGELDFIFIRNNNLKTPITEKLDVSYKDRMSVLTKYLLEYIKGCPRESDSRGNFIIPLDRIDKSQPIFNNPLKESNIITFVNRISSIIETNKMKVTSPPEKLDMLMNLILENFKCNFVIMEVLIYATTTFNAAEGNFKLGRNSVHPHCEDNVKLFRNRDFAGLASFQKQMTDLKEHPTRVFVNHGKQENPMAVFFTPKEIVNNHT